MHAQTITIESMLTNYTTYFIKYEPCLEITLIAK